MTPSARPTGEPDEIDLRQFVQSVWAGRYWVATCSALGLVAAMFYLANTPPTYQADVLLQLEQGSSGGLALPSGLSDFLPNDSRAATEIEIISSRLIIGQVVAEQNLDWQVTPKYAPFFGQALARYDLPIPDLGFMRPFARKGDTVRLELLEVAPDLVGEDITVTAATDGAYSVQLPDNVTLEGKVGQILQDPSRGFALKIAELTAPQGRKFTLVHLSERKAIDMVRAALSVTERGRQSSILEVRYKHKDGIAANRTLNGISPLFSQRIVPTGRSGDVSATLRT